MAGYIGTKAVNLSTTGADINGNANVDGTLDVAGAFTSLGIDDNASATAITIDASGNVGIGTSSPIAKLSLEGPGNALVQSIFTSDNVLNTKASLIFGTTPGGRSKASVDMINSSTGNAAGTLAFSTNNGTTLTERMRIYAAGDVGFGAPGSNSNGKVIQASDGYIFFSSRVGTATATHNLFVNANGAVGSIQTTNSNTAYNTSSDYRLKENITPIQGAGDIVKAMRPYTYTFKADGDWADGFLAHELQELHPVAVSGSKDAMKDEEYEVTPAVEATYDDEGVELTPAVPAVMGTRSVPEYQGVDYSKLTPILTAALQEALNKIDALEARLTALEATP